MNRENIMEMTSAAMQEREEKLKKELKSTAESWRWKFNLPEKPNYDNVYFYKKSKKIFSAPCYDLDMDRPPENYRGEFLQVKNALHQVEFRLRRAQEEAKKKKQDLANEWKELEVKEMELKENFVQFNKFLTRNTTKRNRAEQKFNEMKTLKLECTRKIEGMGGESEKITAFVEKLKERVLAHQKYENYLSSVVMTGSFKNIHHVINRYVLLEETKQTVGKQMNETSEEYHNRRTLYIKMLEVSELKYLSLSNQLSEMRRKFDDAKYRTSAMEVVLQDICNKYAYAAQNISWSRMALRHMFDMAFTRIRRRRMRLVKTKKDDLGKMLRVNETLKALERIESQLRKLHGQKNVGTSMEPVREEFEIKEVIVSKTGSKISHLVDKWKAKRDQQSGHQLGDLAGYLKLAADMEKPDDICPIKLSEDKWKYAQVKDFEERYRKAVLAIKEDKLKGKWQDFTHRGRGTKVSYTSIFTTPRTHKTKWAAAAVAQKMAKDSIIDTHVPTPTASNSVMFSTASDSCLTVYEDADDLLVNSNTAAKRLQMQKLIERKFAALLENTSPRDLHDSDKDKPATTLPAIDRNFMKRRTIELSASPTPRVTRTSHIEKLPLIGKMNW